VSGALVVDLLCESCRLGELSPDAVAWYAEHRKYDEALRKEREKHGGYGFGLVDQALTRFEEAMLERRRRQRKDKP